MNTFKNVVFGQGVVVDGRRAIINGVEYPFLDKMKCNNITTINNKVYVDGYELVDGKWKRTLKALWHKFF